jgi:hypothetical protein
MLAGLGLAQFLIYALIAFGVLAVFWVILTQALGWTPPAWGVRCVWIVIGVVVGVFLIKFLLSLA